MIRCLIVDDEPIARQIVEQFALQTNGITVLASCRNAMEAFAKLEQHEVDLIFLDIEMPLVNGLDFLKTLAKPPQVILTTAYPQYAVEAFALNAVDYLLKPFSLERFQQAVAKVKVNNTTAKEEAHLLIRERGAFIKIRHADILYLKASKDYVKIITAHKTHLFTITMKALEELLPAAEFVRIHKSFIVNTRHIRMVKTAEIVMPDNEVLPLSPNYKERLKEVYSR